MKRFLCFLSAAALTFGLAVSCENKPGDNFGAPTGLSVARLTPTSVTLVWQHSEADRHEISLDGGEVDIVTEPTYTFENLTPQTDHTWKVRSGKNGGVWSEWVVGGSFCTLHPAEPEMVFIKGGTYMMGSTAEWSNPDEAPVHQVTVSDFYIGKYEVTQAQWYSIMKFNPSMHIAEGKDTSNMPVENMIYDEIVEFIGLLNEATDGGYLLPTEAQWEFAARGGNQGKGHKYAGSDDIDEVGWYYDNSRADQTHPVGQKKPNELGLYDMTGNVYEYCSDWYGPYQPEPQTDPVGSPTPDTERPGHITRGGGWGIRIQYQHVTFRNNAKPDARGASTGLRLARMTPRY